MCVYVYDTYIYTYYNMQNIICAYKRLTKGPSLARGELETWSVLSRRSIVLCAKFTSVFVCTKLTVEVVLHSTTWAARIVPRLMMLMQLLLLLRQPHRLGVFFHTYLIIAKNNAAVTIE